MTTRYQMVFRATRPEGTVRKVRAVYARDYEEAEAKAVHRARALLHGSELDWDVDVTCPPEECRE